MEFDEKKLKKAKEKYRQLLTGDTIKSKKSWWFRISRKRWFEDWKELKPIQKSIMLSLWIYAGKKDNCWVSERKLASDLNVSLKSIWRNIKILESKGFFQIKKEIGQKGKYNHYYLLK